MQSSAFKLGSLITVLATGIFGLSISSQVSADVMIYRGIDNKNATYAKVADNQWRIDDDGMSTFELAQLPGNKPCMAAFHVVGPGSQPTPGIHGIIAGFYPYGATYTPNLGGAGHWSLQREIDPPARPAEITAFVIQSRATAKNPNYVGKTNSQCLTPDAPN